MFILVTLLTITHAWRVTVLGLCVCVSVTTFSATTRNRTSNKRYQRPQRDMRKLLKMVFSLKMHRLEVRALAIRAIKSAILLHVHSPYTVRTCIRLVLRIRALLESALQRRWVVTPSSSRPGGWGLSPTVAISPPFFQ